MSASVNSLVTVTDLNGLEPDLSSKHPKGWYKGPSGYTMQLNHGKPLNFTAVIEFLPGKPRGNHYHRTRAEYLTVLSGEMAMTFWDPNHPADKHTELLTPGKQVFIPAGVAHVYMAKTPTIAIEQAEQHYSVDDTITLNER